LQRRRLGSLDRHRVQLLLLVLLLLDLLLGCLFRLVHAWGVLRDCSV
jgi:uncharacterized membrane protein